MNCLRLLFEWSVALMVPSWAVLAVSLTSRRATSGTQRLALISGLGVGSGLVLAQGLCGETEWFGVWVPRWDAAWTPVAACCFTALAGYAAPSIGGRLATRHELRGLVIGCGELGDRRDRPPPPKFTVVERWR